MLVEPGFFRTKFLSASSTTNAAPSIPDCAGRTKVTIAAWSGMSGKQGGDPAMLAVALVKLAALEEPRFAAGAAAVQVFEDKPRMLLEQAAAHRDLSIALEHAA